MKQQLIIKPVMSTYTGCDIVQMNVKFSCFEIKRKQAKATIYSLSLSIIYYVLRKKITIQKQCYNYHYVPQTGSNQR